MEPRLWLGNCRRPPVLLLAGCAGLLALALLAAGWQWLALSARAGAGTGVGVEEVGVGGDVAAGEQLRQLQARLTQARAALLESEEALGDRTRWMRSLGVAARRRGLLLDGFREGSGTDLELQLYGSFASYLAFREDLQKLGHRLEVRREILRQDPERGALAVELLLRPPPMGGGRR